MSAQRPPDLSTRDYRHATRLFALLQRAMATDDVGARPTTPRRYSEDIVSPLRDESKPRLQSHEWKVVNGRLIRKARSAPHERMVSALYESDARDILPRYANEPRSPTVRRKLAMLPDKPTSFVADHVARVAATNGRDAHNSGRKSAQPTATNGCWLYDTPSAPIATSNQHAWSAAQMEQPVSQRPHCAGPLDSEAAASVVGLRGTQHSDFEATTDSRAFLRPSGRSEAVQLALNLDRKLQESQHDYRAIERSWQITFCEVVRQVYVHCAERGMLLDRVRRWYDEELKRVGAMSRHASQRERRLRDNMRAGDVFSVAELDSSGAMDISSQRLEVVQLLVGKTGMRGLGKLVAESTSEFSSAQKHELLGELLHEALPLPSSVAGNVLVSAMGVGPHAQRVLMHRMQDCVAPEAYNDLLVETYAAAHGGTDAAEGALADVLHKAVELNGEMSGMDGSRRAERLMSKLVPEMTETSRGAAIGAILHGQTTEQKATALGDALSNLADGDAPQVLKELVEHLLPRDRIKALLPLLKSMSSKERLSILSPLLGSLSNEELVAALESRVDGEMQLLSAMPPKMVASVLSELPKAVDGEQLAGILPPISLQLWGVKMLTAAPESACKAWLTQLLLQLKSISTHSALSQLLVGVVSPEVFAYAYANLGLDDRLQMLRNIYELKQLGVVSPAPWSKQEVKLLADLLDLRGAAESAASTPSASPFGSPQMASHVERRRRGSVVGAAPVSSPLRTREKMQLLPLDQTTRIIADIYQKKAKDDQLADTKLKPRCPIAKFVRNYLLRQYGMKSMAEKALRELTATVRAYSQGGDSSLVRIRMFGEMAGMLKDAQNVVCASWIDRKADFFLFVLVRLARSAKEESVSNGQPQGLAPNDSRHPAALSKSRRQLANPASRSHSNLPIGSPSLSIKEVLCREEVTIPIATVFTVIEVAVPDLAVRSELERRLTVMLEQQELDDEAPPGMLHMDDVLEVAMLMWDEQQAKEAPRIALLLQDSFQKADIDGNGRMSFHAFERFCMSRPHASLDEDQILDLFDEAIRVTEELTGEETDTVLPEGFARVVREHNILSLQKYSTMVDAVAVSRQENGRPQRGNERDDHGAGGPRESRLSVVPELFATRRDSRAPRRTVIKTTSSKANESHRGSEKRDSFSTQKPDSVYKVICTAVQSHFLFRHLDKAMLRELVQRMVAFPVVADQDVIRQGDKGDYFYVAERGVFDVIVGDEKVHRYTVIPEEGKHPCFGELALLYAKPRAATIRAAEVGMLWGLDRRGFRSVQMFSSGVNLTKLLRRMDVLSSLPFNSLQTLMNHMVEESFGAGECVFRQGDVGDKMYVITHGSAVVTKAKRGASARLRRGEEPSETNEEEVMQLEEEMYFGERALLDDAARAASVRALTPLRCSAIDRATFEQLLGPLQSIIDADRQRREREAAAQKMRLEATGLSGVSIASFRFEAPMLRMETGGVMAALHMVSKETYSVRAESKLKLFELEQGERVIREVEVMRLTSVHGHLPMLPAMLCTFATPLALFSIFKTRIACELSYIVEQRPLSPDAVRSVGACVISALERLHCRMGVVYRNLSPDALAVDENGCVCLMDFRQAKLLAGNGDGKTFTLCGAADYLSPEQVTCSGHSLPVDFWGLGILLWEVSLGQSPWGNDPNEMNIYRRITDHVQGGLEARLASQRESGFLPPDVFVPTLVDLIDRLLVPDPLGRLGASAEAEACEVGFELLKGHAWFSNLRWDQLVEGVTHSPLLTTAATLMREKLEGHAHRTSDDVLEELAGTTEFSGEGSWFSQY